jgi:hypothetical protein
LPSGVPVLHKDFRVNKHIILTSGRSGSTYLSNLLSQHPNVINYGEVLGEWTTGYKVNKYLRLGQGNAENYLDFIYGGSRYFHLSQSYARVKAILGSGEVQDRRWPEIKSFGVKDFAMNLIARGAGDYLEKHPEIRVISLFRENALRRYASIVMMNETGVINTRQAQDKEVARKRRKQVYLDPALFIDGLRRTERVVQDQLDMTARLPPERVLSIRYEDLFASAESKLEFADRMFRFLEVRPLQLESSHKKLNSEDLKELIENYDEIFELCQGTPDERYFYF